MPPEPSGGGMGGAGEGDKGRGGRSSSGAPVKSFGECCRVGFPK